MMPTYESGSLSNWVMASANSRRSWRLIELRAAGRLRVMVTMLPCFSYRMVSGMFQSPF